MYVCIPLLHVIWHRRQCVSRGVLHILPRTVTPALSLFLPRKAISSLQRAAPCTSSQSRPPSPQILVHSDIFKVFCLFLYRMRRCNFTFKIPILTTFPKDNLQVYVFTFWGIMCFVISVCVIMRTWVTEERSYKPSINPVLFIHICLNKWVLTFPVWHYGMKPGTELLSIVRNWLANL